VRFLSRVQLALHRARGPILASAATYALFVGLGIGLASAGWPPAVEQRDAVVAGAGSSPINISYDQGNRLQAALLDFGSNLFLGAVPTSVAGLSVIGPFPIAAYRGWVGGIVSIDRRHVSRLASPSSAVYYVITLALQLIGYVLTMGAGVHVGLAAWRLRNDSSLPSVLGMRIPTAAIKDGGWVYALAVPVFLAGSLWEFMS
jgi:hypothetical protein